MDYLELNKAAWNQRTQIHIHSKFYDVAGFVSGQSSLTEIELGELPPLQNKRLLHLQCHFGLDTLSLARMGAIVTGVDLSDAAIEKANELSKELAIEADFVCQDILAFGQTVQSQFDVVFTSFGVLCWLPDLSAWANTIANSLVSGGQFYIAEFHPFADVIQGYSYFHSIQPDIEKEGTYTENCSGDLQTVVTWPHTLSDAINALIKAGLIITSVNEYDFSPYNCFKGLKRNKTNPNRFQLLYHNKPLPLVYSICAVKE
ncbi:class I SAM-dependent methyltransferase [Shewanella gaetbuli]|uniref:Class I SAM-dependent methyltransferase n=1 Tax=Shewanella gaetbuli TaxID=220752 RepID=A0A9X2CKR9_9GAMM|nr:class I SAM-dependent methyltransferase [Shewanella gaetbuli]MCL1143371.1 class I SAM-dependent methyltransferase [Shewanella gaetbuli]